MILQGENNIEGYVSLRHEDIPYGERGFLITGGKYREKMILPGLDCAFGGVAMVAVGSNAFEIDLIIRKVTLDFVQTFIVKYVQDGCISILLGSSVEGGPGALRFTFLLGI